METKSAFASKTMWVGIATALLGVLDQFVPIFGGSLPSWSLSVLGVIMMVLRQITTGPVSVSGSK